MINLSTILRLFNQNTAITDLTQQIVQQQTPLGPLGVPTWARPAFLAALNQNLQIPILFITARSDRARLIAEQLRLWAECPDEVRRFPDPGVLPYERIPWTREIIAERLAALTALCTYTTTAQAKAPIIVTSSRALMQQTIPLNWLTDNLLIYQLEQQIVMTDTLRTWINLGYQSCDIVENPGEFSHRGGIMDIFPPSELYPIRIDLFGDEIDSLRTFDPLTQRSEDKLRTLTIGPATEALPLHALTAVDRLQALDTSRLQPMAEINYRAEITRLEAETAFPGIENYLTLMSADKVNLLDLMPPESLIIIENPTELATVIQDIEMQADKLKQDLVFRHELPCDWPIPYFTWTDLRPRLKQGRPLTIGFDPWPDEPSKEQDHPFQAVFTSPPVYGSQIRPALQDILKRRDQGERVIITSRQAARLSGLLDDEGVTAVPLEHLAFPSPPGSITLFDGPILEGFLLRSRERAAPLLTILTDAELFGVRKSQPRRRPKHRQTATPETFFEDVKPDDYVVHIEHGIGIFKGLVKLDFDGSEREYLQVAYNQNDKLYVPIHHADRLSRYVGSDDNVPSLNRLGTAEWSKTKKRAKAAIADIADELLRIYAEREMGQGRAFSPDTPWQREIESAFPYVETEDQLNAIAEVKQDMERVKPMDRLICGDVGFGKTEVALRAAIKAVMDGTQVALLVPTTVLAQQHYNTFRKRLAAFPINVEMLSRFRTRKEADQVLSGLASGSVDIVIGTHSLLQKNMAFKNLGLLIIDEEQRFGVPHKERLKELRTNVDTLTLSATPIPRTLHLSMTGIRDMSLIVTPPEERLPIKTTVTPMDDFLMRTALQREIDRGGQVYFVHNRVLGIEAIGQYVNKLVPEARVVIGHGQMSERRLEKIMLDFAQGEYDVLVSTTIIESGLDIPNVNTIIINRADAFGLAQLYQLRGRVGRSAVQAYAYLLVPKNHKPSDIVQQRLEAIQEADELGAGFKIAMRDLEIRGAGDLLGAKQHGHISAVGFDLYVRLLAQSVQQLKSQQEEATGSDASTETSLDKLTASYLSPLEDDIQINLPMAVYIPEEYLTEENLRLRLYRRMANLNTLEDVATMGQELEDRFGELPDPVLNLIYQLKLKVLCRTAGVKAISANDAEIMLKADALEDIDRQGLERRLGIGNRVGRRQVWLFKSGDEAVWRQDLEHALTMIGRMVQDPGK